MTCYSFPVTEIDGIAPVTSIGLVQTAYHGLQQPMVQIPIEYFNKQWDQKYKNLQFF